MFKAAVPETSLQGGTNTEEKPVYWFPADVRGGDTGEMALQSRQ